RDLERRDAIVLQPRSLVIVVVISRLDQDAIERKRTFHVERDALADPISLDSFGPWRLNLPGWIVLYVNDVVIVFALRCQRRACCRIIIGVIEKILMFPENILCVAATVFFRISGRVAIVL